MLTQGFILQPADLNAILAASEELTEGLVFADAGYTPDQNLDMLVRTIRMLQVGMGVQLTENADLTDEFNKLQEEFTVRERVAAGKECGGLGSRCQPCALIGSNRVTKHLYQCNVSRHSHPQQIPHAPTGSGGAGADAAPGE